jgi:predicted TIM-barrel fold metal-dependent hydrolase
MDSSYKTHRTQVHEQLPRPPSEYMRENVFLGASFTAPFEAQAAVRDGFATNLLWGSDYPHSEGTFQNLESDDDGNMTRLSMRHAFAGLPFDDVRRMVGDNLVRVFGLDREELRKVATRIAAPTFAELTEAVDVIPETGGTLAFRTIGAWG